MKWFYNLKIGKKLLISFFIMALISVFVGIVGILGLNQMEISVEEIGLNRLPSIQLLSIINEAQTAVKAAERTILSRPTASDTFTKESGNIERANKRAQEALIAYEKLPQTEKEAILWKQFVSERDLWQSDQEAFMNIASTLQSNPENVEAITAKLQNQSLVITSKSFKTAESTLGKIIELNAAAAEESNKAAKTTTIRVFLISVIVILISVFVAIGFGIWIARIISRPVNQMVQAADKLALGDINVNVSVDSKDEIGQLADSFIRMVENVKQQAITAEKIASGDLTTEVNIRSEHDLLGKKLYEMVHNNNQILTNIADASDQVAEGSRQVSDASITLSQGATEQASSIEELTASIEEIFSQTEANAKNAEEANILAKHAKSNAAQGNSRMHEMLNAMEEINESSANISKIINVIDAIAFQTNILALNAAVEAARAGQHGRGFAVVAEEVRNLAIRSAEAAKETTSMIEGSIKKVEDGRNIAKDTAESLDSMVNEIEKVANLINGIAIASNEQALGIGQVNQGIMQISDVVQANAATSEESAAASEELSGQASLLKETVAKYKLKKNAKQPAPYEGLRPEISKTNMELDYQGYPKY